MLLESVALDDIFGIKKLAGQLKFQRAGCMNILVGFYQNKKNRKHSQKLSRPHPQTLSPTKIRK